MNSHYNYLMMLKKLHFLRYLYSLVLNLNSFLKDNIKNIYISYIFIYILNFIFKSRHFINRYTKFKDPTPLVLILKSLDYNSLLIQNSIFINLFKFLKNVFYL